MRRSMYQAHDYQYIYFLVVYLGRAKYSLSHGLTESSITNKLHLLRRSFSGRSVNGMARLGISVQFIGNTIILYYTIELRLCVRKNAEEIFICSYVNIVIQIILDLNSSTALRVAINQATSALRRKYFGDLAQHHV